MKHFWNTWMAISLVKRIGAGLVVGILLGLALPQITLIGMLGSVFVGALKSIAPLLVFFLVMSALAQQRQGANSNMRTVIGLYLTGTFLAALVAVVGSFLFPVTLALPESVTSGTAAPDGVNDVLMTLILNIVQNPVSAIADGNFIGILAWAVLFGLALKQTKPETKTMLEEVSNVISQVVRWVIELAPLGILGLVFTTVSENGLSVFLAYGQLLVLLLGCMGTMAFVVNPILVWVHIRQNPYPLVFRCLKDSFVTAFFTRSSAANIPVNMKLCADLGLDEEQYAVSIPLGATINMTGAAITITVMTLAAAHTLGYGVDMGTALVLSMVATVSACGASGVAGGSLLLIPLACSLFGISNDVAMQVVAVGFLIGVVQDAVETGLNSSTDALFTAAAEFSQWRKDGKDIRF